MSGFAAIPAGAQEQGSISRPVVQALPSREALELNAALSRLGRNPKDIDALLDAGDAASGLGDYEAAVGFYKRARQVSQHNPRALSGLAGAMVHDGDPFAAIPLFDQAELAGADPASLGAERGLAYDLVGDPASAQRHYRAALSAGDNPEVSRRLAVSLAISGEAREVERTLLPLLHDQDKSAWRARAFSLAILGKTKNAVKITNTLLPEHLAKGITPYLEYMPRLTAAQQAAAANLGKFPRASEIGRDDARVAQFRRNRTRVAAVEMPLVPAGKPLGAEAAPAAELPFVSETKERAKVVEVPAKPVAATKRVTKRSRRTEPPEPKPTRTPGSVSEPMLATGTKASPAQILAEASDKAGPAGQAKPAQATNSSVETPGPAPRPSEVLAGNSGNAKPAASAPELAAAERKAVPAPSFDLASLPRSSSAGKPPESPPETEASFERMFGDLGTPAEKAVPKTGAVDIRKIEPAAPQRKADPPPPSHPSRIWVQLGIGQNISALKYDWRRLARKSPERFKDRKPYVSKMNRTNRLLAGPFESSRAANAFISELREAGVDGPYVWSSPAGQVVDAL